MADNFQTGGVHTPKSQPADGAITPHGLDVACEGTNTGSPLDDKDGMGISNKK